MNKEKPLIGVIGPNAEKCNNEIYDFVFKLGVRLSERNICLVSGGKLGVMEAVFKGAKSAPESSLLTIGIIPEDEKKYANNYCDIVIPTGIGTARNKVIINTCDIIIAIAGGAGTLSEIAFAWQMNKPIIAYTGFDGWARNLAGKTIDNQNNSPVYSAISLEEITEKLDHLIQKIPKK